MDVRNMCIVGAGVMGHQLAQVSAMAGFQVAMQDISQEAVDKGLNTIRQGLQRFFVDKGKMSQGQADEIMARLRGTTDLEDAARDADLVIEAVAERMEVKKDIFRRLSAICRPDAILASNTSALSISDIASAATNRERVLGLHFFNPVPVMKLVEIVRGAATSDETIAVGKWYAEERLHKETVVVKDSPGFITSRMVDVIINEAACMFQEGLATAEDIDKAIKLGLAHPMGPLELADYASGIEITEEGMRYMMEEFGDPKYRPAYILTQMMRAGHLGKKSGRGFYNPSWDLGRK